MNTKATFESAEQMAGWLHYGGKVFNHKDQQVYIAGDFYRDTMWDTCSPIGELPENWCPLQKLINACERVIQDTESHPGMVSLAKKNLPGLKAASVAIFISADPRFSKK